MSMVDCVRALVCVSAEATEAAIACRTILMQRHRVYEERKCYTPLILRTHVFTKRPDITKAE